MELLDRYLKAVAMWLPRTHAADIVAELRGDIEAEIDDRRATLGRALTREEEEAILTRWGHPRAVASRYQAQDSLIGPTLLPAYLTVLRVLAWVYVLPWLGVWAVLWMVRPEWYSADPGLATLKTLLVNVLFLFTAVTVGFALTERAERRHRTLERWTARQLTDPESGRDWRDIPRAGSAFELSVGLAVLAWWGGLAGTPATVDLDGVARITWTPLERGFYWTVLVLMAGGVVMSALHVVYPRWTSRRLAQQAALDAAGLVLVALLSPAPLVEAAPGAASRVEDAARLVYWLNVSWTVTLAVAAVILAARIALSVRRLTRLHQPQARSLTLPMA